MSSEERVQVLEMLAAGKITVEQASQLLEALGMEPLPGAVNRPDRTKVEASHVQQEDPTKVFFARLTPNQIAGARTVGVDRAFIRELHNVGLTGFSMDDLIHMRTVGVNAAYIRELEEIGMTGLTPKELAAMRAVGVTADYIQTLRAEGFGDLPVDKLVRMRAVGVDADYIRELHGLDLMEVSIDELVSMKTADAE